MANSINSDADVQCLCTFQDASGLYSVAISPDGETVITGGQEQGIGIWEGSTGRRIRTFDKGHSEAVMSVAISPDGRKVVSSSRDQTIKIWDFLRGKLLSTLQGHSSIIPGVMMSPDGENIISFSADQTIKVWQLNTGREILTLPGHQWGIDAIAVSPDGQKLVSCNGFITPEHTCEDSVILWDLQTGAKLRCWEGDFGCLQAIVFSADGQTVIAAGFNAFYGWNILTGESLTHFSQIKSYRPKGLLVTPDGSSLINSCENLIEVWRIPSAEKVMTLTGHLSGISSLALSSSGKILVSAGWDGRVKVWHLNG